VTWGNRPLIGSVPVGGQARRAGLTGRAHSRLRGMDGRCVLRCEPALLNLRLVDRFPDRFGDDVVGIAARSACRLRSLVSAPDLRVIAGRAGRSIFVCQSARACSPPLISNYGRNRAYVLRRGTAAGSRRGRRRCRGRRRRQNVDERGLPRRWKARVRAGTTTVLSARLEFVVPHGCTDRCCRCVRGLPTDDSSPATNISVRAWQFAIPRPTPSMSARRTRKMRFSCD